MGQSVSASIRSPSHSKNVTSAMALNTIQPIRAIDSDDGEDLQPPQQAVGVLGDEWLDLPRRGGGALLEDLGGPVDLLASDLTDLGDHRFHVGAGELALGRLCGRGHGVRDRRWA